MKKYQVVQIGLGVRGVTHLKGFLKNSDRFEVVGICDLSQKKILQVGKEFGISEDKLYQDAEEMVKTLKPDVMSFTTLPHLRLEFVEMVAKYGVKGLLMEKPMATSVLEAKHITNLCSQFGIKTVVCHQMKYFKAFKKLKEATESGELGAIYKIDAECQAPLYEQGVHYIDYSLWANNGVGAESVIGHVHGRDMLKDHHPSPDYMMGEAVLKNGVRLNIQCGYFTSPKVEHVDDYKNKNFTGAYWTDGRLTVYGVTGYAWAECNGRWTVFS